jgi:hypothetical protein
MISPATSQFTRSAPVIQSVSPGLGQYAQSMVTHVTRFVQCGEEARRTVEKCVTSARLAPQTLPEWYSRRKSGFKACERASFSFLALAG